MAEESAGAAKQAELGDVPGGVSALVAKVLDQISLSAWLPSAFLTVAGSVLLEFRAKGKVDLSAALSDLTRDRIRLLILILPVLITVTIVTQAFSFEAIRTLEGYWHRPGPAAWMRSLLIRWQVYRRRRLRERRLQAAGRAFAVARSRLIQNNIPAAIVNALEAQALGAKLPPLLPDERWRLSKMNWRAKCDAWDLARVDHLVMAESDYPVSTARTMPTRVGNVIRATEDRLKNAGQDLQGFALRRRSAASGRVRQQHDRFRTRLDMYSTLVFVTGFLALVTPPLLLTRPVAVFAVLPLFGAFTLMSHACYQAVLASARGYCVALQQMDEAPAAPAPA